jgi:glyceraldehyde 3-phosphate dehydrogenase
MAKTKVAINGFGRIGRISFRCLMNIEDIEIVAINDLTAPDTLAHLLKYDSAQGKFPGTIETGDNAFIINGKHIKVYSERDPEKLPWSDLGVEIVLESTGFFTDPEGAGKHLKAGAKKVVISAPAKGNIPFIVLGVNQDTLKGDEPILSNASCTTNCLAPMVKVLEDNWGIEKGYMTTVHAYTADQKLQDAPHKDLRRARAAGVSIVPTSTGAAGAVGKVIPSVVGKLDGMAMRVPTVTGSITDFTATLSKEATAEEINAAMKKASETSLSGIMEYVEDPIVSVDVIGNTHSCVFDSALTKSSGKFVKVVGWYDNEAGYSNRVKDLIVLLSKTG